MMAQFTLSLIVVLAACLEIGLSSFAGSSWNQQGGGRPGFGVVGFSDGKCSAMKGILPDPKSGCCGRHAGADETNPGGDDTDTGGDDEVEDTGNDDGPGGDGPGGSDDYGPGGRGDGNGIGGGPDDDEGVWSIVPGGRGDGNGPWGRGDGNGPGGRGDGNGPWGRGDGNGPGGRGDGNGPWGRGDGNVPGGRGDGNGPWGRGGGNGFPDWDIGNGIGGGMGDMDFDNIFGGNRFPFSNENRLKRSANKNASDTPPDKFITAGKATGIAQYPWLVHLNVKVQDMMETKIIGCGGSLISSRHVITAAHCLDFEIRSNDDVSVFLAEYNTKSFPTDCVGRTCIKNLVMHPDKLQIHSGYQRGRLFNDIGMIRLKGSAPYTDYIRPICLPPFDINNAKNAGTTLTITGWGQTERGQPSSVKLHTQVHLVAPSTCKRHYEDLTKGQLCASGKNGHDTCMGDSGGPIMVEREGSFYLVGLVSGKRSDAGCGSPVPTLYTYVFAYRKWIDNFMRS